MTAVDIEEISAEWLSAALDTVVRSVSAERIGTGQTGASYRLSVDADDLPATMVAKVAAGDDAARGLVAPGYRNEVGFYAQVAGTVDVRAPRCWYSAISDDARRFTLLLEDLAPRVAGVQADGCATDRAAGAVRNLAGLHAPRWSDGALLELDFISGPGADNPEAATFLGEVTVSAAEVFVDRYAHELDASDVDTLRESAAATSTWVLARREPFALVHGDYRLDNLMFGADAADVVAVDWQTLAVAPPARDLAYFLGTSLHTADRREADEPLVGLYHAELCERGVMGYSFERCFDDYRLGMLQGPMITLLGAAYATAERSEAADAMFLAMARRSCAAIRDLGSIELL